ncbi:MAG TPA: hypothetical protein VLV31_12535 [Candidatus Acidoferrales bacterium]|nr:hypothetical protein [Candidatus Acidoferrales bacterium]
MSEFKANRGLPLGRYKLKEVFSGIGESESLQKCVGNHGLMSKILEETYVTLVPERGYMYVNDEDGSLVVGADYLRTASANYLYLDVIHELVHVKQYLQGKELFDENYSYVDRPTEIEAYKCSVEEARLIGMDEETLAEYIYVEWISRKDHARLLKTLGVRSTSS